MGTTWDYAIREFRVDGRGDSGGSIESIEPWLQDAGGQGWELVSMMPVTTHSEFKPDSHGLYGGMNAGEHGFATTTRVVAVLKRPIASS